MDKWMKGRRVFHKTLNLRIQKGADYQLSEIYQAYI